MKHQRKYLLYKARSQGISLEEAAIRSLARMKSTFEDESMHHAIITAFRGEWTLEQNRSRNVYMARQLTNFGYGYVPAYGGTKEHTEDGKVVEVEEEVFVVSGGGTKDEFYDNIENLVTAFSQEAAVVKFAGEPDVQLLTKEGEMFPIGKFNPMSLSDYYTQMRKGPEGRRWSFESVGDNSLMTRMAVRAYEKAGLLEEDVEDTQGSGTT